MLMVFCVCVYRDCCQSANGTLRGKHCIGPYFYFSSLECVTRTTQRRLPKSESQTWDEFQDVYESTSYINRLNWQSLGYSQYRIFLVMCQSESDYMHGVFSAVKKPPVLTLIFELGKISVEFYIIPILKTWWHVVNQILDMRNLLFY